MIILLCSGLLLGGRVMWPPHHPQRESPKTLKKGSREENIHPHPVLGFHELNLDLGKLLDLGEGKANPRNNQLGLTFTSRVHSFTLINTPDPGI